MDTLDYSYQTFQGISPFLGLMALALLSLATLALYFLPSIIAIMRQHPQKWLLAFLNIFAGWTGIFWIGLLVWALWPREKLFGATGAAYSSGHEWGPYAGQPTASSRPEDTLEQLARLRERGILSDDEFAKMKERIISRM